MAKVMAIDYGEVRIGVAASDLLGITAQPLCTVKNKNSRTVLEELDKICRENKIEKIIVGLPKNMNGSEGEKCIKVRAFGENLKKKTGLEIKFWDERLSTAAVHKAIHEIGGNVKKSRESIDKMAAVYILQGYLEFSKGDN